MAEQDPMAIEKTRVEGIQSIMKAQKEGFSGMMESVQKSHETRTQMTNARTQSIRDTGGSGEQEQKEKVTLSREAQEKK
ncbi:MAG: hypothetical protein AB2L14_38010 [Candidatus Xenobiia bacterium LiM19]